MFSSTWQKKNISKNVVDCSLLSWDQNEHHKVSAPLCQCPWFHHLNETRFGVDKQTFAKAVKNHMCWCWCADTQFVSQKSTTVPIESSCQCCCAWSSQLKTVCLQKQLPKFNNCQLQFLIKSFDNLIAQKSYDDREFPSQTAARILTDSHPKGVQSVIAPNWLWQVDTKHAQWFHPAHTFAKLMSNWVWGKIICMIAHNSRTWIESMIDVVCQQNHTKGFFCIASFGFIVNAHNLFFWRLWKLWLCDAKMAMNQIE